MNVPFYKHSVLEEDIERATDVLRSDFLTTGETVKDFEEKFAQFFRRRYCVGTTNWTSSAELALKAWNIGKGDEVIVPTHSYVATAHCVEQVGAKPIFVDCEPSSGLIDIDQVEEHITSRTKAIIPTHIYGVMADVKKLRAIADKHGLKLLEDAAHAIESRRENYQPGEYGDSANFSFYATKNITCGEGGALVTDDKQLAEYARKARRAGTTKSASDRSGDGRYQHYDADLISGKCNMTNISAALLLGQLKRIHSTHTKRKNLARYYTDQLQNIEGITLPRIPKEAESAHHIYVVLLQQGTRERVFNLMADKNIGCAVNFRPIHLMTVYREKYGYRNGMLPVAEDWGERCLTLPLYPSLTHEAIDYICETFRQEYQQIINSP